MKKIITIILSLFNICAFPQDTLHVMHYNLMYYGQTTSYCDETNNNEAAKTSYLKTIVQYVKPDVLTVNEVAPVAAKHQSLMDNCLNVYGTTYYKKCNLSNYSNSDLSNELYYNSDKLGFLSQINIATSVRDINIYKFYYKSSNLATVYDTAYVTFIIMHLKAGSATADATERATQTNSLMNYLNSVGVLGNCLVMGDFNVYSSSEACYQNLVNYQNANVRFYDPINMPGDWNSNSSFANIHTQSTHSSSSSDCFASGGLDDRFDNILTSDNIINGLDHFQYLTDSYITIGQDGNHLNQSVNSGSNTSAPDSVIEALYGMSDHLPVTLKLKVDQTIGIDEINSSSLFDVSFNNPVSGNMNLSVQVTEKGKLEIIILNLLGQQIFSKEMESHGNMINCILPTGDINKGIYLLQVTDSRNNKIVRKFVKG
jgi:endonuclease/exonuclease/phosphatase family metal-dependent hydrolase